MPRFRHAVGGSSNSPLLPAPAASSLRPSRRKTTKGLLTEGPHFVLALVIAAIPFGITLFILSSLAGRHQKAAADGNRSFPCFGKGCKGELVRRERNADLERRLDALIVEAAAVAKEKSILTEIDAAENEERWRAMEEGQGEALQRAKGLEVKACTPEDCWPHGTCNGTSCQCAAAFSGRFCGHGTLLSRPYSVSASPSVVMGYAGDIELHQESEAAEWLSRGLSRGLSEQQLRRLRPSLSLRKDAAFKGTVHDSCAVVGPGGSLLLAKHGAAISSASLVLRAGGPELVDPEIGGKQPGIRILSNIFLQKRLPSSNAQIIAPTAENLAYLLSNTSSGIPWVLHPNFLAHVQAAFTGDGPVLQALMLALNVCRTVKVYGIAHLPSIPGLPPTFYDACEHGAVQTLEQEWPAVLGVVQSGMVTLGEACVLECAAGGSRLACSSCLSTELVWDANSPPSFPACSNMTHH